ncbi:MAG: mucoidy inhibitor MuiA family protein [Desulfobacterales bacterium]|nr:mucoidy inhibitor MuiA family protein [Desulfobacterales bacterium]
MKKNIFIAGVLVLMLMAGNAVAAPPVILESEILEATVYADRAMVTRVAEIKLQKGEHVLLFDNLPDVTERNSIQVNGKGKALLKDIKFTRLHFADITDEAVKVLYDKREKLSDEMTAANDVMTHAANEKVFVENITKKLTSTNKESTESVLDPAKWMEMVSFYRSRLDELDKEIRKTEKDKRAIQQELNKVNHEINEIANRQSKMKNQVSVLVNMKSDGPLTLMLSYIVYGPGWYPAYDIRVSTDKKNMNISYNAVIRQNTTENWNNVKIKLSTAKPNISGRQPELRPWYVDIMKPGTSAPAEKSLGEAGAVRMDNQMFLSKSADDKLKDEDDEQEMTIRTASIETKTTSVVFAVPGQNTVKSDNQEHKVTIGIENFAAQFRYSAVPRLSPYAYLKANVTNKTEYPFLPGKTSIFLDNNFVANARMNLVAAGEDFWTFLGIDEGIKVEHKLVKRYRKNEGIFTQKQKVIYEYLMEITNNKKTEEEIVIWDQIPISNNQAVVVELIEPQYKEDTDKLKKNEHDFLEWYFKPEAGEKITIPFQFSVEYPKDQKAVGIY